MKANKMTLIMIAIGAAIMIGALGVQVVSNIREDRAKQARAWSIVCDSKGTFSFYDGEGELSGIDFPNRALTEAYIAKLRETEAKAEPFNHQKYQAEKAAREARFAPCKD